MSKAYFKKKIIIIFNATTSQQKCYLIDIDVLIQLSTFTTLRKGKVFGKPQAMFFRWSEDSPPPSKHTVETPADWRPSCRWWLGYHSLFLCGTKMPSFPCEVPGPSVVLAEGRGCLL